MNKVLQLIGQILNGVPFATFELDALRYRAEPIKIRQQVLLPNLPKDKVTRVDLLGELKFNLLVTGVDIDLREDDNKDLRSNSNQTNPSTRLYVSVINRKTDLIVKKLAFHLSSYPDYTNEIILNPDFIYDITPDRDVNLMTFTGEPVHLRDDIKFLNAVRR